MCFSQKLPYRCRIAPKSVIDIDQSHTKFLMPHAGFLIKNGVRTLFEQSDEMISNKELFTVASDKAQTLNQHNLFHDALGRARTFPFKVYRW